MRTSIRVMMILAIVAFVSDAAPARQQSRNRSRVRQLVQAADAGETSKVLQILNSGVNVNASFARDESELSGKTALMAAASRGHSDLVSALIKRGATVDLKHYSGQTALMFGAHGGDKSTIEALLRAGADVNASLVSPHAGEFTPLTITINTDHAQRFEVARILLAAKAEVNPKGRFFVSPLMHALKDFEMVQLLIAHGADVNQKNFRGATALMAAAGSGATAVVKYLIEKGADVRARDQDGNTALMYAERDDSMLDAEERNEIIRVLKRAEAGVKP
ncbi:MAG TPA: ankyrin repeat domain-containing protein [Pyrinomonadaceae bacterium]|nr:ankyrin repeat domain-containing protein [Pyrinomonadaceae bacterium]